jgi:hypothetical protein
MTQKSREKYEFYIDELLKKPSFTLEGKALLLLEVIANILLDIRETLAEGKKKV